MSGRKRITSSFEGTSVTECVTDTTLLAVRCQLGKVERESIPAFSTTKCLVELQRENSSMQAPLMSLDAFSTSELAGLP